MPSFALPSWTPVLWNCKINLKPLLLVALVVVFYQNKKVTSIHVFAKIREHTSKWIMKKILTSFEQLATLAMCSHKKHFVTTSHFPLMLSLGDLLCTTRFYCCWMWPHAQSGSLDPGLWQSQCCFLLHEDFMVCFCMSYLCFLYLLLRERDPEPAASRTETCLPFPCKRPGAGNSLATGIPYTVTLHISSSLSPGKITVIRPEAA